MWVPIKLDNLVEKEEPNSAVQVPSWLLAEVLCKEEMSGNEVGWRALER